MKAQRKPKRVSRKIFCIGMKVIGRDINGHTFRGATLIRRCLVNDTCWVTTTAAHVLESNMRPLTACERGPRPSRKGKR